MKYKDLKDTYNPKEYVKSANDPYSPGWSGFASFVLPGLGQVINGETGRGIAFFAGDLAIGVAADLCADKFMKYVQTDANGKPVKDGGKYVYTDDAAAGKWAGAIIGVSAVGVANYIWSICDARKVAKVKNMAPKKNRKFMVVALLVDSWGLNSILSARLRLPISVSLVLPVSPMATALSMPTISFRATLILEVVAGLVVS